MSNYFICVGGTGARVGEAFVYLVAAGYFHEGTTKIWIVDKDTKCGNGATLNSACNDYRSFRAFCRQQGDWFNQELSLSSWNFDDALKAIDPNATGESAFRDLRRNNETDIAMKFLHDAESLDNSMSRGFYGRAQTGTALYKGIEKIPKFFANDSLFKDIKVEIDHGQTPCIYLAGSSFGATGASLLPNMAKTLRSEFGNKVTIGAVLMMPYFSYGEPKDGSKALVAPTTHQSKAAEALRYYGDENRMSIRKIGDKFAGEATLDAFYIVGCDPITDINPRYSDGGSNQENNAHIAELYAAMGAKHFFDIASGQVQENPTYKGTTASFAYCLGSTSQVFDWSRIDGDLKRPMLVLARYCLAELTWLHPTTHLKGHMNQNDTLKKCFGTTKMFGGDARISEDDVRKSTETAARFSQRFIDYLLQISGVGPDVQLFDETFLQGVVEELQQCSGDYTHRRLRDLVLLDQYDDKQRAKIHRKCQLSMVRDWASAANPEVMANSMASEVISGMSSGADSIKRASAADGDYKELTIRGMRQMHQLVYDYAAHVPLAGVAVRQN